MSNAVLAVQPIAQALDIHPVAGRIGAEIRGIKLSGGLDAATVAAAAAQAMQECTPISNVRSSADYRREMVGVLTRRAVTLALEEKAA